MIQCKMITGRRPCCLSILSCHPFRGLAPVLVEIKSESTPRKMELQEWFYAIIIEIKKKSEKFDHFCELIFKLLN